MSTKVPGIVSDDEKVELETSGIWTQGVTVSSKRTVSGAMLAPPTSSDSSLSSTSPTTVVFRDEAGVAGCTFDICEDQESPEALMYIGFLEDTAKEIWERYEKDVDPDSPNNLMAFVRAHIQDSNINTSGISNEDAMTKMGLTTDFQNRLLNPDFSDILRTETLEFWVIDTLELNLDMIGVMLERSKTWAARSIQAEKSERKSEGDMDRSPGASSSQPAEGS